MAIEIVSFPIKNGDFPIAMLNYQRVVDSAIDSPIDFPVTVDFPLGK